jgi:alanyl-tRNA synthetase
VIQTLSSFYPELIEKESYIQAIINEEERAFSALLPRGLKYLTDLLNEEENQPLKGAHAFYLYDTLGFPIDLTQLILEEKGRSVNMVEFDQLMSEQKSKSREKAPKVSDENSEDFSTIRIGIEQIASLQAARVPATNDAWKYQQPASLSSSPASVPATLQAIITPSGDVLLDPLKLPVCLSQRQHIHCGVIVDQTPFYSESGGQIADVGTLVVPLQSGGHHSLKVIDVQVCGPYVVHTCTSNLLDSSSLDLHLHGTTVSCTIDQPRRLAISSNHTMTHLLNSALRKTLSSNSLLPIDQKGSLVTDDKLRFDFSYSKALTRDELVNIELSINSIIHQSLNVQTMETSLEKISQVNGLRAVFGETYTDPVRVVSIGASLDDLLRNPKANEWLDLSIELCGGSHLTNTSDAQLFRILEETSIARGVRRITAVTGRRAFEIESASKQLKDLITTSQQELSFLSQKQQSSLLTSQELSKYSLQLTTISDQLTLNPIPAVDRLDLNAEFLQMKSLFHHLLKQHISDDINTKIRLLIAQADETMAPATATSATTSPSSNEHQPQFLILTLQSCPTSSGELYQLTDSIHLKTLTNHLNQHFKTSCSCSSPVSYLLLIEETKQRRFTCVSSIQNSDFLNKGITASEWISCLMKRFHGKGGGKKNLANGRIEMEETKGMGEIVSYAKEIVTDYERKMRE